MTSPTHTLSPQSPVGVAPDSPAATAPVPEDRAAGSFSALLRETDPSSPQAINTIPDRAPVFGGLRSNLLPPTLKPDMLSPPPTLEAGITEEAPIILAEPVDTKIAVPFAVANIREGAVTDQAKASDDTTDDSAVVDADADADAPDAVEPLTLPRLTPVIALQNPPRTQTGEAEPGQKIETPTQIPLAASSQAPDPKAPSVQSPETAHPSMLRNKIESDDGVSATMNTGEQPVTHRAFDDYLSAQTLSDNGTNAAQHIAAAIDRTNPGPASTIAAQSGYIGRELGVAIAHHISAGADEITLRLDPAHFGQIEVRMHFDTDGRLHATITASHSATLEMLRRDSADLNQALGDAGFRTDADSFTFDSRSGGAQHREHGAAQSGNPSRFVGIADSNDIVIATPPKSDWRPLRSGGKINMIA